MAGGRHNASEHGNGEAAPPGAGQNRSAIAYAAFFLLLAAGPGRAGEASAAREDSPLLAVFHIADLQKTLREIDTVFQSINPGVKDARSESVRNPLRWALAGFLRTSHVSDRGGFLEILVFDHTQVKGSPLAAAFPLSSREAPEYVRGLTANPQIEEEGQVDRITTLREVREEGVDRLYFTVARNQVAIFGAGLDAVRRARDLYDERPDSQGRLANQNRDLVMRLDLRRLLHTCGPEVNAGLQRLREDIVEDALGDAAGAGHALDRPVGQALGLGLGFLEQISFLEAAADLDSTRLELGVGCQFIETGAPARLALASMRPIRPGLCSLLPPRAIALQEAALWPGLWDPLLRGIGSALSAGFSSVIDQAVGEELELLLKELAAADPVAVASGLIPPPPGKRFIGPVRAVLVRWQDSRRLESLGQRLVRLCQEQSPVHDLLVRNRIECRLRVDGEPLAVAGGEARVASVYLGPTGGAALAQPIGILGAEREYLIASADSILVIVTSRPREVGPQTDAARAERLRVIGEVLAAMRQPAGADHPWQILTAQTGAAPLLMAAALAPVGYAQLALAMMESQSAQDDVAAPLPQPWTADLGPGQWLTGFLTGAESHLQLSLRIEIEVFRRLGETFLGLPARRVSEP